MALSPLFGCGQPGNTNARPPSFSLCRDPQEWLRHSQAMTGPAMMFVTLNKSQKDGTYWSKKAVGKVRGRCSV